MSQVTAVLIGAGGRGIHAYAPYALERPDRLRFVAVADPDPVRRQEFAARYRVDEAMCFTGWEQLLARPRLAEAAIICTQDRMHYAPAMAALAAGYHVLLEKPISPDPRECVELAETARRHGRLLAVCHVLRYTPFFATLKRLLDEGRIGRLISIQHNENVSYFHMAHAFVRGHYRNSTESSPMILAKCCHDMDIMLWLAGADCVRLASFGSLLHFRPEEAPPGAPARCLDGCPAQDQCPYDAARIYLNPPVPWLTLMIGDGSREGMLQALRTGPYGRCVYRCDNDVVDHQVVSIEFANGVTAAFTMCGFTQEVSRTIKLMGTHGEIRGYMEGNEIEVSEFSTGRLDIVRIAAPAEGHGGGDVELIKNFTSMVAEDCTASPTSAETSVQSHLMSFAAEKSRREGRVVVMEQYRNEF